MKGLNPIGGSIYQDQHTIDPGWRRAAKAALADAFKLATTASNIHSDSKQAKLEALYFLLEEDTGHFDTICRIAGRDPDYVRQFARKRFAKYIGIENPFDCPIIPNDSSNSADRWQIMQVLQESDGPLTAKEICDKLEEFGFSPSPTRQVGVYLGWMSRQGVVEKHVSGKHYRPVVRWSLSGDDADKIKRLEKFVEELA